MAASKLGDSLEIVSNQSGIHENLVVTVKKHLSHSFHKPFHDANLIAFEKFKMWYDPNQPLFLDSCCGVGESTYHIAQANPNVQVLGCDISTHRLQKSSAQNTPDNMLLLHADIVDIWRLLADSAIRVTQHTILYPNPWPKSKHLQRRWHGSAVFPTILQLGGALILRSNWQLYLQEFAEALSLAGFSSELLEYQPTEQEVITPFERKYLRSLHGLYQLSAKLD